MHKPEPKIEEILDSRCCVDKDRAIESEIENPAQRSPCIAKESRN